MVVFMRRRQLAMAAAGVLAALALLLIVTGSVLPPITPLGWRIWKGWGGR